MRLRSWAGFRDSPKPTFWSTVSQGNTPFSWNTKMRRGSGPVTASPCTRTSPRVGRRKPPITFSSVDLPQPEAPTMQSISPGATSKLMSSSASTNSPGRLPEYRIHKPRTETAGAAGRPIGGRS